ncbi:hypothetical protein [Methylobacterium sp. Leaf100]|uniref:relaxase/mobilization nuclease domain-containing protein n=1 Tax=Methylobacterium sp. Leaf100 TaxID=1736252 RepID=UPI0006FBC987|nr:hypothetical protein [Methylobacterium sp. Leaf100]KQP32860.1 hypothetical protein ASF25_17780 [Methylobacterium sp. Leaf100]
MISGASRGSGIGDALAKHLLKAENDLVRSIAARGLGSADLAGQIRELVAVSAGGRTDRPIYHVHCNPDAAIGDESGARARWWTLFEAEFGLTEQAYCGVEHVKHGRSHEHRVYGLVRPSGKVVDLAWDYPRREKCSRIVEFEFGLRPVASKHARSIERRLRREGRSDVADWLVASGATTASRPIAALTPVERLQQERTDVPLDDVRRAALAAWRASDDAAGFVAALRARGLDLTEGRKGPVIVDGSGASHLATRVLGAASRRHDGERIPAAAVRARLAGHTPENLHDRSRHRPSPRRAGAPAHRDPGGAGAPARDGGGIGIRRPGGGAGRPDGGGGGRHGRGTGPALDRLKALPPGAGFSLRCRLHGLDPRLERHCDAVDRARAAAARIEERNMREQERAWALWGLTDIWGLPLR